MKLTKPKLRTIEVYNPWDFAGEGNVFIAYAPTDYGRGGRGAHVTVIRPGYHTDPKAHWQDNGNKTFSALNGKEHTISEAKAWASDKYGIGEWDTTPFGTLMSAEFVESRTKELQSKLRKAAAK